jgi:hypothetical protein
VVTICDHLIFAASAFEDDRVSDLLAHQRSMAAVLVLLTLLAVASASLCPRLKGKLDFEPQKVQK